MKPMSARLAEYLAQRPSQIIAPDCYVITLADGRVFYFTNADVPVVVYSDADDGSGILGLGVPGSMVLGDGTGRTATTFLASQVRIAGVRYKVAVGLDVDEQDVTISYKPGTIVPASGPEGMLAWSGPPETIEGQSWPQALMNGLFDGATLARFRAFLPAWGAPAIGTVLLFYGYFSTLEKIGRAQAQLKIKTPLVWLDADMPRNIYQASCWYTLYGFGCGVARSGTASDGTPFTWSGTVASADLLQVDWTNAAPANWFDQGTVTFTSGVLAGDSFAVNTSWTGGFTLRAPLPELPAPGDAFTIYAGCDRTVGGTVTTADTPLHGCWKFSNVANFPAFPYVPPPTTAI
ncbi:MAG TPA: DUF2163 domain-containing protein [Stellaceae bacterium]|nr:DUF2163 domain-containing protein [Stellaceae bacterium]